MRCIVKLSTIDVTLMILSIAPISIIPHTFKVILLYIIIIYILLRYLNWENIKYNKMIILLLLAYTFILSYSSYINTNSITWTLSAFMTGMQYIGMFLLFYSIVEKRSVEILVRDIMNALFVLILLNDLLVPVIHFHIGNPDELYLLGNKFSVSYLHCLFGAITYVSKRGKLPKKICLSWFAYSMLISMIVKCTTGIIISMALIVMIFFPSIIQHIVNFSLAFPLALGVENILIWGSTNLFKQPWLVKIITDVFHKSPNMTGRERLYNVTMMLVGNKPLFGYGHKTDIYINMFGYGNAQNGLFHIVTQVGIVGAVIYFSLVTFALINKRKDNYMYGLYIFVYAMLIGSAIEINLSEIFLVAVALIYAYQRGQVEPR